MSERALHHVLMIGAGIAAGSVAFAGEAAAQAFQCSGGPNERMVGTEMQGPVTVPICVSVPPPRQAGGAGEEDDDYVPEYLEGPRPEPPRGWSPLYAGFAEFVSMQDENGDNKQYDYVLTINHPTPQSAKAAAEKECMGKAFFPDPSGACQVYLYDKPYLIVWQDWSNPGKYKLVAVTNMDDGFGDTLVRGASGETLLCKKIDAPDFPNPCNTLVALLENGRWPKP